MNQSAFEVFARCDGRHTLDEIAGEMAAKYGLGRERLQRDVLRVVEAVAGKGLLEMAGRPVIRPPVDPSPHKVLIELTYRCNLRCRYCYVEAGPECRQERTGPAWCETISLLAASGVNELTLSGGEPLLRPDIGMLLAHAVSSGIKQVNLLTNGTLVTPALAAELEHLGVSIHLSFDSPTAPANDANRGQGSHELALRGLQLLLDRGLGKRVCLSVTPTRVNAPEVPALIDLAVERGIGSINLSFLVNRGRATGRLDDFGLDDTALLQLMRSVWRKSRQYQGHLAIRSTNSLQNLVTGQVSAVPRCALDSLRLTPEGEVYPCVFGGPEFRLGHVDQADWSEWVSHAALRRLRAFSVDLVAPCRSCMWRYICAGGCRARSLQSGGSLDSPSDMCWVTQHLFEEVLWEVAGQ